MNGSLKGKILATLETRAHAVKIAELEALLGTPNAAQTARLNLFFGPTVIGESNFVKTLELNFATPYGEEIQVQTTTFIERMLA